MLIPVICTCGKSLKVKPEYAGKRVRCPQCQSVLTVPASVEPTIHTTAISQPAQVPPAPKRRTLFEHLTAQRQDPAIVEKVMERVSKILTASEEVRYIAIQQRPLINWFPDCIVLTDRRVILYQPKIFGRVEMLDFIWRRVRNAKLREDIIGATLSFEVVDGQPIVLDYLPKEQARELYRFAQEFEEAAVEERRLRRMEEDRAKAGGIQIMQNLGHSGTGPQPSTPIDPVQKLQQLKQLLEAGLLTPEEYEIKRTELIKLL